MSAVHHIWLPMPLSVNNLFAHGNVKGRTRRFPTSKYKAWRKEAVMRIRVARLPRFAGPVAVKLTVTAPDARPRDIDNYSKCILDSLVDAGVLIDDSQVQKLLSSWDHSGEVGAVVEIAECGSERAPLTPAERRELSKLRQDGPKIVTPTARISRTTKTLIEKGYVEELPGLFDGVPQGFVATE